LVSGRAGGRTVGWVVGVLMAYEVSHGIASPSGFRF
jgi:hypothetical protein